MAHHKSAKKRIRSSETKRQRNKASISKVNSLVKKVLNTEDKTAAEQFVKEAVSFIDKAVSKKQIPLNTGSRRKSSITRYLNTLTAEK